MLLDDVNNSDPAQEEAFRIFRDTAWSKCPPWHTLAVPQLGSCASSGRAWRLWAARHSQEEAGPLGTQPLPRVLELAASKAADFTAFDPSGDNTTEYQRRVKLQVARTRQIFAN